MILLEILIALLAFLVTATIALGLVTLMILCVMLLAWYVPKVVRKEEVSDAEWISFEIFINSILPQILYSAAVFTIASIIAYGMTHHSH